MSINDVATRGIYAATGSVARAIAIGDAVDGGCKGGYRGCPSAVYGGSPLAGGEQGGCPCVWS